MELNIKTNYANIGFKDNGKLKILIIVGPRPEIIRLSSVIQKCRTYFDCILAHTGQNYDYNLNGIFFHDLKIIFTSGSYIILYPISFAFWQTIYENSGVLICCS